MFPFGTDGYHIELTLQTNQHMTSMQYYKVRLMIRTSNYLLYYRDLLSIFIVDMYINIESERMLFLRSHQHELKSESYGTLRDAVQADINAGDVGKLVVLPSTFTGSPCYMHEKMQDGMSYIRKFGTADFFITFTCNPKWQEIQNHLYSHQAAHHRHDLIARVFNMKLKRLMKFIYKRKIFGDVPAYIYSVEWQKRGNTYLKYVIYIYNLKSSKIINHSNFLMCYYNVL